MAHRVAIEDLKPGMVILQITQQNGPVRIRKSGLVTSDAMVAGLREMGVQELAIDPEQTVELDNAPMAPVAAGVSVSKQSQTQFLLQSNISQSASAAATLQDSQLSEQFNRSVFLPTAQDIPDTWQVYGKRAVLIVGTIVLGFGLGFFGALLKNGGWFAPIDAQTLTQSASKADEKGVPSNDENNDETALKTSDAMETQAQVAKAEQENKKAKQDAAQTLAAISESEEEAPEQELLVLGMQPGNKVKLLNENGEEVNGKVLTDVHDSNLKDSEASKALLKKLQKAVAEVDAQEEPLDADLKQQTSEQAPDVPSINDMPEWVLSSLPKMSFSTHIYATEPADRWVKVNGKELGEGDWIDGQLRVERIEPQHVILTFQGHEFSMRALSEW
ncbi:general secretion pathway protein GspB [Alteromonas sp. a30]|uniref:general secretion pathway protein GspB n=1 Tax=Alteromonas sp. a30 TaxID=2730917 RepID=UPI00227DB9CF|nr:general secretion pathway protein GspB [Alteromonas sp. a30]MCY7296009.1 GspB domain-containing protein [Alteromonas sp. a30]